MPHVDSIVLPELSGVHTSFSNSLSLVKMPIPIGIGKTVWLLHMELVTELPVETRSIKLQSGVRQFSAHLAISQLANWMAGRLNILLPDDIPALLLVALLEKSLLPLQKTINAYLGHTLSILTLDAPCDDEPQGLFLNVHITADISALSVDTFDIYVPCHPNEAMLLGAIKRLPRQSVNIDYLPIETVLHIGHSLLDFSDYSCLTAGDIIVLDHCFLSRQVVLLKVNNIHLATASLSGGSLTIQLVAGVIMKENIEQPKERENPQTTPISHLKQLPVRLNFDLGMIILPIKDLETLAPGRVFELSGQLDSPVRLTVNGVEIAQGELVKVGDRPCVRVVSGNTRPKT